MPTTAKLLCPKCKKTFLHFTARKKIEHKECGWVHDLELEYAKLKGLPPTGRMGYQRKKTPPLVKKKSATKKTNPPKKRKKKRATNNPPNAYYKPEPADVKADSEVTRCDICNKEFFCYKRFTKSIRMRCAVLDECPVLLCDQCYRRKDYFYVVDVL